LCLCSCHSECPLADRLPLVTRQVWQAQCICPGADLAAVKLDEAEQEEVSDFAEFERQWQERQASHARESQQRRAARHEAFDATRAASTGKNRAEIRQTYLAELRARGLTIPSDLVLDATADAVSRNRDKFSVTTRCGPGRDGPRFQEALSAWVRATSVTEFAKMITQLTGDHLDDWISTA